MEDQQFDTLAKLTAAPISRKRVLKAIAGAALGSLFLGTKGGAALAAAGGNDACAQFCNDVFPPGSDRGACKSDAAHGAGLCYECGPGNPSSGLTLCGQECADTKADTKHCGACDVACPPGQSCIDGKCGVVCYQGGECNNCPGSQCSLTLPGPDVCLQYVCDGKTTECSSNADCPAGRFCTQQVECPGFGNYDPTKNLTFPGLCLPNCYCC